MLKNIFPSFISSKISRLKLEKVVSPPKNPDIIKSLTKLGNTFDFKTSPNTSPIIKHPIILTKKVPITGVKKYFFDNNEIKYLKTEPMAPPKNTDNIFSIL